MELTSIVVVPARDEERRIAACLRALAEQTVGPEAFEVVLVLDALPGRHRDDRRAGRGPPRAAPDHGAQAPAVVPAPPAGSGWSWPPNGCTPWGGPMA